MFLSLKSKVIFPSLEGIFNLWPSEKQKSTLSSVEERLKVDRLWMFSFLVCWLNLLFLF